MKDLVLKNQVMKITVTDDKLKMEIPLSKLAGLYKSSPNNYDDSHVKKGKNRAFAEYVAKQLQEQSQANENDCKWLQPFEEIFDNLNGDEEFIKFNESC